MMGGIYDNEKEPTKYFKKIPISMIWPWLMREGQDQY